MTDHDVVHTDSPAPAAKAERRVLIRRGLIGSLVALALIVGLVGGAAGRDLLPRLGGGAALPQIALSAPAAPAGSQAATSGAQSAQPPAPIPASQAPAAPVSGAAADLQNQLIAVAQQVGPAVVQVRTPSGLGSGVIYDASGLVLTNAHVVDGARQIKVRLADGRQLDGRVLGSDSGFDLAVIKVEAPNLPTAPLGDSSSLRVGQMVVAIGNPYGLDNTVTNGVVSALNRPISEGQASYSQPMIQTNAAINPGNSGGPLVDLQGRVVGVTTLVAAPQGFPAQGLGFAVPADTARRIAPQLAEDGRVAHSGQPYLGVSLSDPGAEGLRRAPGTGRRQPANPSAGPERGALVQSVEAGGPASQAGLRQGDVITSVDGREVYTRDDLLQILVLHRPGDQLTVGIQRGGQPQTVTLTLGEAPPRA